MVMEVWVALSVRMWETSGFGQDFRKLRTIFKLVWQDEVLSKQALIDTLTDRDTLSSLESLTKA